MATSARDADASAEPARLSAAKPGESDSADALLPSDAARERGASHSHASARNARQSDWSPPVTSRAFEDSCSHCKFSRSLARPAGLEPATRGLEGPKEWVQEGAGECTTPNFGAKRAVQSAPECTIGADSLVRSKRVGVPAVRIEEAIKALPEGDVETPRFDSQWTARLVHVTEPDGFRLSVDGTPSVANFRVPTAATTEALFKIGAARISDTNDRNQPLGAWPPWSVGLRRDAWSHPLARTGWLDCSRTNRRLSTARSNIGT